MGNTNTGFDWGNLAGGLAAGAASYGVDRLKKQEALDKQNKQFEFVSNAMNDQLNQFQTDYKFELSGQLSPQEIQARDQALAKTRADLDKAVALQTGQIQQAYSRSGVGGEELARSIRELSDAANQKYLDYEQSLNMGLMDRVAQRQSQAKAGLTQIKNGVAQTLTPMQAQLETNKAELSNPSTMSWAQYLIPGVTAATVAGVGQATQKDAEGNSTYAGPTADQAFRETSLAGLLQNIGIDPKAFAAPNTSQELPSEVGGEIYQPKTTAKRDVLGNVSTSKTYENKGLSESEKTKRASAANQPTVIMNADGSINQTLPGGAKIKVLPKPTNTQVTDAQAIAMTQKILTQKGKNGKPILDAKKFETGHYAAYQKALEAYYKSAGEGVLPVVVDTNGKFPGGKNVIEVQKDGVNYRYKGSGDLEDPNSWKKV